MVCPRTACVSFSHEVLSGIPRETLLDDPQLGGKRHELIKYAIGKLVDAKMVVQDPKTENYAITELGRIAAKYYLRYTSVEIFNKEFRPRMSEADVLAMLSMSTEVRSVTRCIYHLPPLRLTLPQFDQIQLRDSETKELEQLMERAPCDVKVNKLLLLLNKTDDDCTRVVPTQARAKSISCFRRISRKKSSMILLWFPIWPMSLRMVVELSALFWKLRSVGNGPMSRWCSWG